MSHVPYRMSVPYRVGRSWLAQEYLAGRTPPARREFLLDPSALDGQIADRCLNVVKALCSDDFGPFIYVHGTGIDGSCFEESNQLPEPVFSRLDDPIRAVIGDCPEITEPTEDAEKIISAYERWIDDYRQHAPAALSAWSKRFAKYLDDYGQVDPEMGARGLSRDQLEVVISYRVEGQPEVQHATVSAQKDLSAFQQARSAWVRHSHARRNVRDETVHATSYVLGEHPTLPARTFNVSDLVEAYERWAQEWESVALAHHWALKEAEVSFEDEMAQWAEEMGSERLKLGLADGFRMTRVYLEERISYEAPGFYALFEEEGKKPIWRPRNGPTEHALQMRRWVQDRLAARAPHADQIPKVTIGWIPSEDLPSEMVDWDLADDYYQPPESFEAIVVPGWLGRYTLIGPIGTQEQPAPEHLKNVLRDADYDPDFVPPPPGGGSAADDDVPF